MITSTILRRMFSVTIVCLARLSLPCISSCSDFLTPINLKLPRRGLSTTLISIVTLSSSIFVTYTCTFENSFCRQRLEMVLAKISSPGCVNLSPGCNPVIERTMEVSRCLMPVIFIPAIVYSLGMRRFGHSNNFGSTEVGLVLSCACKTATEKRKKRMKLNRSKLFNTLLGKILKAAKF